MSIQNRVLKIKAVSVNFYALAAALVGLILAVMGPFLLLTMGGRNSNNLPWYVWVIIPLLLMAVVAVGFFMFKRDSHDGEDMSISPKNR
jgi:cytochrome c biogenesis factor